MSDATRDVVLLVGHGSRDPSGEREARAFAAALQARIGEPVRVAFLEFNEPPLATALQSCIADGAVRVTVVPLFLGAATHQKNDVPTAIQTLRQHHSGVEIAYGAPLGAHALLAEALSVQAAEAAGCAAEGDEETAVLLVGRGSRDPDSNGELYKVGRLLFEGRRWPMVEACFIAIAAPDLPTGIERCVRLGARRIVLVPQMLFDGVLVKRIARLGQAIEPRYDGVRLHYAAALGAQSSVIEVVRQRIEEARSGTALANCDACKYRVRMTGFEDEHGLPQGSDHNHGLRGFAPRLHAHPHPPGRTQTHSVGGSEE
jgi:sirohydrochlorin cobaltochelatase